jgi:tyrosyl-tRNA synthetase
VVLIMPILVGLDGAQKMSKSKGNYVGLTDTPKDMFGKVMSIPDNLMANYFTLLTELPAAQVTELADANRTHPRQAKATLARMIVGQYHGQPAGAAAEEEFTKVFSQGGTPEEMPQVVVGPGAIGIIELIVKVAGFAASNSEARRLIQQNAVSIDGQRISDPYASLTPKDGAVLKVGKLRFGRITVKSPSR